MDLMDRFAKNDDEFAKCQSPAELARLMLPFDLYDSEAMISPDEVDFALAAVPDDIILSIKPGNQEKMLFLRTFVDHYAMVGRILQGDLYKPMSNPVGLSS